MNGAKPASGVGCSRERGAWTIDASMAADELRRRNWTVPVALGIAASDLTMGVHEVLHSPSAVMLTADQRIDRRILLQAESLKAAGWDVVIVAPAVDFKDEPQGSNVLVVRAPAKSDSRGRVIRWAARLRRRLKLGERSLRFLRPLTWRFAFDPETFYLSLLLETALKYRPSVFVAHDLPMLPVSVRAAEATGGKLIYDSHELYPEQEFTHREKLLWRSIEARYIGRCDAVMTVNQSVAGEIQQRYGVSKVDVILNAERCPTLSVRSKLLHRRFGLPDTAKIILFQGGLLPGRNLETMIRAVSLLKNPTIHLVLLGDGLLRKSLERKTRRLRLGHRVHFQSAVAQSELLAWTSSADAGVIPYTANCMNNYYCTPNKLFEFIAAGIPIVASALPELDRFVRGHDIGLTGDTTSPTEFASIIDELFRDAGQLNLLRGRVLAAQQVLNWEVESKSLLSIYARVL